VEDLAKVKDSATSAENWTGSDEHETGPSS
jgi:hypothetical protein